MLLLFLCHDASPVQKERERERERWSVKADAHVCSSSLHRRVHVYP